jgi:hypothetical protein
MMERTKQKPFIFVLMPFDEKFRDIYKFGIKGAAEELGAYAERVDEQIFQEGILDRIFNQIGKADVIVADMTGKNANVFYEVGYAHALGKIVVLLTQNADDIPFDLKHRQHIVYGGVIDTLRAHLVEKLKWAISEATLESQTVTQLNHGSPILDLELKSYKVYAAPIGVTGPTISVYTTLTGEDDFFVFRGEIINRSIYESQPVSIDYLYMKPDAKLSPIIADRGKHTIQSHNPELVDGDQSPDGLTARFPLNIRVPALPSRSVFSFSFNLTGGSWEDYEEDFPMRLEINTPNKVYYYPFILLYKQTLDYRFKEALRKRKAG